MPVEPGQGDAAVEEQLQGGGAVLFALGFRGALVGDQHVDARGVEQRLDGVVVDVGHRVILRARPLPGLHAADPGDDESRRGDGVPAAGQVADELARVDAAQVLDRHGLRGAPAPGEQRLQVGEAVVVPVHHHDRATQPQPLGLGQEDVLQPGRLRPGGPLPQELQLTRVGLRVAAGRVVELGVVGERADVAAEEDRLEADAQLGLPAREHAQRELQVRVDVADYGDFDGARVVRVIGVHGASPSFVRARGRTRLVRPVNDDDPARNPGPAVGLFCAGGSRAIRGASRAHLGTFLHVTAHGRVGRVRANS